MEESGSISTTVESPRVMSRERIAWAILLAAFSIFGVLAVTIPWAANWYIQNATIPQRATVQATSGDVLLEQAAGREPVAIEAGRSKEDTAEQTVIRADGSAQALILFFEGSTLTVFPNSTVTLTEMRQPRFGRSEQPPRVVVTLHSGRVRAQIAPVSDGVLHFEIQTPHALAPHGGIVLDASSYASYAIEVTNDLTHVSVRSGEASVSGQTGQAVRVQPGERAEIPLGAAARGPFAAKRNLLVNSDFQRQGSNNNHGETRVVQELNKLVGDYVSLSLRLDVNVVSQSLSGGGEQSSEYPLIVRVDYVDVNGSPRHWAYGFYCQNQAGYHIQNGEQIPCQTRRSIDIDLKAVLADPQLIQRISLYASGWDWDVYVSDVELIAE